MIIVVELIIFDIQNFKEGCLFFLNIVKLVVVNGKRVSLIVLWEIGKDFIV